LQASPQRPTKRKNVADPDLAEMTGWDAAFVERGIGILRPVVRRYFRAEVHGLESVPPGGALVVSNHSGGMLAFDIPVLAVDFYDRFGYERPLYTLSHDVLMVGPAAGFFARIGFIRATRKNAAAALRRGGVVVVFPGGAYDACRPTVSQNKIDFSGRTGYIATAIEAGVPIVPMVSIGGQESQLFLCRGTLLARALRLDKLLRTDVVPISFGFPFGLSVLIPANLPLPTKIITKVLEPIDVNAQFGENPDIAEVDAHVRDVMQCALRGLGRRRRLPVVG
jgi:1-acyl-sn-glycerol-3-phosphate acyltransferase